MRTLTLRRLVATGAGALALGIASIGIAAPAGAATDSATKAGHHRLHLTAEQKQCMKDAGITRPVRPLTQEKIAAIKAAAAKCNIKVPANFGHRVHLTNDQQQCLEQHGVSFPVRPLTQEKIQTLRSAAQACGIQRPARGQG